LSIVAAALLLLWIGGYHCLDPKTHLSAFCGNAIADWSGSLVIFLGTKFFYEIGAKEPTVARPEPEQGLGVSARTFAPDFHRSNWDRFGAAVLEDEPGQQMRSGGGQPRLGMGTNGWFGVPHEAVGGDRLEGVKGNCG
jgi:hypothetical protein